MRTRLDLGRDRTKIRTSLGLGLNLERHRTRSVGLRPGLGLLRAKSTIG